MTYYLSCEKHTNNIASKSLTTTNQVLRQKSRFLKQKHHKGNSSSRLQLSLLLL